MSKLGSEPLAFNPTGAEQNIVPEYWVLMKMQVDRDVFFQGPNMVILAGWGARAKQLDIPFSFGRWRRSTEIISINNLKDKYIVKTESGSEYILNKLSEKVHPLAEGAYKAIIDHGGEQVEMLNYFMQPEDGAL
jgi:hypothetical protein